MHSNGQERANSSFARCPSFTSFRWLCQLLVALIVASRALGRSMLDGVHTSSLILRRLVLLHRDGMGRGVRVLTDAPATCQETFRPGAPPAMTNLPFSASGSKKENTPLIKKGPRRTLFACLRWAETHLNFLTYWKSAMISSIVVRRISWVS
jgi:hypothetical protein